MNEERPHAIETSPSATLPASTTNPCDTDVLVVGLGPVGAALANLLGRYGVRVLAIDKATEIFAKPRAIALDNEALRILQLAGVRDGEFATIGIPQVQYRLAAVRPLRPHQHAGIIDGHPVLVTFYQPELEQVLRAQAGAAPTASTCGSGITLEAFVDDGTGVTARLKDRRWQVLRGACPVPGRHRRRELARAAHARA